MAEEKEKQEAPLASKCAAEFVGTFLLVFTVGCNVLGKTAVWTGVSIASVLMVSIYAFGGISGGNFNPAVSVALGITKNMGGPGMEWMEVGIYCLVQILAGIAAGMCYLALFGYSFSLGPNKGFGAMEAGMCEVLYTFMLCFVVLNVAASKANAGKNQFYGLAIGFVVIAGAYGAGVVSGGCFNPAVAFGIDVAHSMHSFGWCFAYLAFEMIGACLAAVLFKVVRPGDFGGEEEEASIVSRLTSEFLGTFMLVLTVGLNVLGKSPAGAFSIAAALTSMIYALGDVSGAHFNPAVTVAVLCSKLDPKLTMQDAGCYVLVQVIGGIFAALTYALIHNGETFPLGPGHGFTMAQCGIAETAFTFVLCLVVLCVAVSKKTANPEMFGLAIGSCVTVGGFAIGSISGGALNPAVSFGIASAALMNGSAFYQCLIYTVFQLLGGVAAAGVIGVTHADAEKSEEASA
jgi:aquaporin Z